MSILIIYLTTGYFVSFFVYNKLEEEHITGDQILSLVDYDVRTWFIKHPNLYKISVILAFFVIMVIWPYVLYKLFYGSDDDFNGDCI